MKLSTSDIILASTLVAKGINATDITVVGQRGTFHFDDVALTKELLTDFELSKCLVEPVALNNAIKRLTTSVRRISRPNEV